MILINKVPRGYELRKESKSERLQLLIRPTTKNAIKDMAEILGVSTNDFINTILEDFLDDHYTAIRSNFGIDKEVELI